VSFDCEVGIPVTSDVKELNVTCLRCTDNLKEVKVRYNLLPRKKCQIEIIKSKDF
jgi:hypothetical protein